MVGNINKAKTTMLTERDLFFANNSKKEKKRKKNPLARVRQVY